jgi:hypothetical protein
MARAERGRRKQRDTDYNAEQRREHRASRYVPRVAKATCRDGVRHVTGYAATLPPTDGDASARFSRPTCRPNAHRKA